MILKLPLAYTIGGQYNIFEKTVSKSKKNYTFESGWAYENYYTGKISRQNDCAAWNA